jgi:hypothetical protein
MSDELKFAQALINGTASFANNIAAALPVGNDVRSATAIVGAVLGGIAQLFEDRGLEETRRLIFELANNPAAKVDLEPTERTVNDIIARRRAEED